MMANLRLIILVSFSIACVLCGCENRTKPPVTQPSAPEPARPVAASPAPPPPPVAKPAEPKRPNHPWVIFREAQQATRDADIHAEWTGGNRLEIRTENVGLVTLDLNKLPPDAPRKGPWLLQIDKQGIEIYGRPGMRVLDLVRSRNGDWSVVPDSHRVRP